MPGRVVDFFGYGKRKDSRKSCPCLKIFTCILSNMMIEYRYVARHGYLPLWFHQQFRWTRIETIVFLVKAKHLIYVFASRAVDALRVVSGAIPPDARIEIIIFSVTKMSGADD